MARRGRGADARLGQTAQDHAASCRPGNWCWRYQKPLVVSKWFSILIAQQLSLVVVTKLFSKQFSKQFSFVVVVSKQLSHGVTQRFAKQLVAKQLSLVVVTKLFSKQFSFVVVTKLFSKQFSFVVVVSKQLSHGVSDPLCPF